MGKANLSLDRNLLPFREEEHWGRLFHIWKVLMCHNVRGRFRPTNPKKPSDRSKNGENILWMDWPFFSLFPPLSLFFVSVNHPVKPQRSYFNSCFSDSHLVPPTAHLLSFFPLLFLRSWPCWRLSAPLGNTGVFIALWWILRYSDIHREWTGPPSCFFFSLLMGLCW